MPAISSRRTDQLFDLRSLASCSIAWASSSRSALLRVHPDPLIFADRFFADMVHTNRVIDVLHVAPAIWSAIFQPEYHAQSDLEGNAQCNGARWSYRHAS